ncbi:hypothetical protein BFN03_19490 [Rhodococcus sp. WMMA185]|nr:hypothetical protein BFN03_19490 [Rhodococcus sp. WMMA185]
MTGMVAAAADSVIDTVPAGAFPQGVAINPSGKCFCVNNFGADTVSVIAIEHCMDWLRFDLGSPTGGGFGAGSTLS